MKSNKFQPPTALNKSLSSSSSEMEWKEKEMPKNQSKSPIALNKSSSSSGPLIVKIILQKWNGKKKKSTRINQSPIARKSSSSSSSSDSSDSKVSSSEMGPKVKEKPKNQSKSPKALNRSSTPLSFSDSLDLQKWNGKRTKSTRINPNLQQQETNLHPLQTFQIPLILKIVLQKWNQKWEQKAQEPIQVSNSKKQIYILFKLYRSPWF